MSMQPEGQPAEPSRSPTVWESIVFTFKAVEIRLRFIVILVGMGLVIGFWDTIRNYWDKFTRSSSIASVIADGMEFFCPMHPNVIRPGLDPDGSVPECPICGMPLSKRNKGEAVKLRDGALSRTQLSPERIQLGGIHTETLAQMPLSKEIRSVGTIEYDESLLSRIVSRVDGYIDKLYVNQSFTQLRAGDPLADVYSPELYNAMQELLLAQTAGNQQLVTLAREKLRLLRIEDRDIDAVLRTKNNNFRLTIRAPRGGHLIRKEIIEGDKVMPGQVLFEVADLSQVWLEVEVYEQDLAAVRPGMKVEARVEAYPDREFSGVVQLVHPHLQGDRRTARVRARLDNADHTLRQGMYATARLITPLLEMEPFQTQLARSREQSSNPDDVILAAAQKVCPVTGFKLGSMGDPKRVHVGSRDILLCCDSCTTQIMAKPADYLARLSPTSDAGVLAVPERAVIDTGEQKIVYVEREPGTFEGVEVKLGPRSGGYYAVIEGLLPGDKVATSGAFLIDAETRLNPAASAAYFGASGGPQSGPSGATTSTDGSPSKTRKLPSADNQLQIAKLPEADRKLALAQGTCPVLGEALGSMGVPVKVMLDGKPVFLCCKACVQKAEADPKTILQKIESWRQESAKPPTSSAAPALLRKRPSPADQAEIAKLPEADRKGALEQGTCPATGEALGSMGMPYKVMVDGKAVYLCCDGCEPKVKRDPKSILEKLDAWRREQATTGEGAKSAK